jgi:uncharacterized protein YqjF (DUF2071 family)
MLNGEKLAIANYAADKSLLLKYLPAGTELDLWNGTCYVSLVGFMFLNTRLLGVKVPLHVNFEEVNLRFYVKRYENGEMKRGVVFIRELVPKHALTFVANTIYRENYRTVPMRHGWKFSGKSTDITYEWKSGGKWQHFSVAAEPASQAIPEGSETEFITEHYWGYSRVDDKKSVEYQVTHPRWKHYPVRDYKTAVDFGAVYGPEFAFLNREKPQSVMLAEGSEITVEKRRIINSAK